MSKGQKWVLVVMALVMILVIGVLVLIAFNNDLERNRAAYRLELDGIATQASR